MILTFHETEKAKRSNFKNLLYKPLLKYIFSRADSVYLSNEELKKDARNMGAGDKIAVVSKETKEFMANVQTQYSELIKQARREAGQAVVELCILLWYIWNNLD